MEKLFFNDEKFYLKNGRLYDQSFIEVPKQTAQQVFADYYEKIDYTPMDETQLLQYAKNTKTSECYHRCLEALQFGLQKFCESEDFCITVFPMITSCYRALGQAQKAIDFWMENKMQYAYCFSVPLLTSLAAAYCDVGNYQGAKACADRAYALQGGSKFYQTELSLVYGRIKKETK